MPHFSTTGTTSGLRSGYQHDHHLTTNRLHSEKVRLLYDNLWQPVLSSLVAGMLLVAAMWPIVTSWILLTWLAVLTFVSVARLTLAYYFRRLPAPQQQRRRWLYRFSAGAIAAGCVWGAGGFVLFTGENHGQVAALSIVLAGIAAGGVTTLSAVWWVALGFVLPVILPLLVQFLLLGSPLAILIGAMISLFLGLIIVTSRRLSRIIHDNIALRVSMSAREAQLQESENRYRSIFQNSPLGVLHFDEHGHITDCNDKLLEILNVNRAQLLGFRMLSRAADVDVANAVREALSTGSGYYEGTYYLPKANEGTPLRAFFNGVHSTGNDMVGGVAIIEDFSERKHAEAIIYHQASYDSLTDLPNRRLFIERLETLCDATQTKQQSGFLMFLDMDRFKLINDTWGHATGDELLIQVARRLESCLLEGGIAARLSGDEFVLLVLFEEGPEEALEAHADIYMRTVQQALSQPYRLSNRDMVVTPSIGYTRFTAAACDHEEVLKQADIAMYQAKTEGRALLKRYQPWMRDEVNKRVAEATANLPTDR